MSGNNPVVPDAPPAYSPPSHDFQRQQQQLEQDEQYKIMQHQLQQQPTQQYVQQPLPQLYNYGTYPQGVVMTPPLSNNQPIIIIGGCPACRVGVLEDDFSLLGLCCAIAFFPIGLLCCLVLREQRCSNCGAVFG